MFKNILSERKLTQTELALKIGVKQQLVSCWVKGKSKPKYKDLMKLSEILKIPVNELLNSFLESEVK